MGEKCPEASSQEPEGEKAKQGRLHNIGEQGDSSAGNHRGVQALVEILSLEDISHKVSTRHETLWL